MNFSSRLLGVTCASVIALGVSSVNATDLYRSAGGGLKDGPYVPPPLWTGFYVGVNGGGSFGDSENLRVRNNFGLGQRPISGTSPGMAVSAAARSVITGPASVGVARSFWAS
jgi:hypothetical protein